MTEQKSVNNSICYALTEKRKRLFYVTEECGNKAKIEIEYTHNNKLIRRNLCKRHFNSVTKWLKIIKVSYTIKDKQNEHTPTTL